MLETLIICALVYGAWISSRERKDKNYVPFKDEE